MKNILLTLNFVLFGLILSIAQGQYESGMGQAFDLWTNGKHAEAVALFERISQAETENWLPSYYAANVLITQSFAPGDLEQRFAYLESAKAHIEKCHERSPDNSEVYTLEGLLYTGYVAADPGTYGMTHSQKIMDLHGKALELDPDNPRALSNSIEYEMGTARFFGQDLTPFCERLNEMLPLFEKQNSEIPFAPKYGKERVTQIISQCGS
ncbi:MAG: hypothetical protein HKO89_06145 [Saprospiraceae bacterium]|nr:hypothetical protein [Bacteroidia bacterium]NNK90173.1 hypothetical protein [Saprospiraceae bacterium]